MDVEFIKWMCEKADGFSVLKFPACTHIRVPFSREHSVDIGDMSHLLTNNKHMKGYLLQRAIEGVNLHTDWFISQYWDSIEVDSQIDGIIGWHFDIETDYDNMKEQVLRYIYDQERQP